MLIGYMRVSKADGSQVLDMQRDALLAAGIDAEHMYEDLASGSLDARPGLISCLRTLRAGDTLLVWKLDRLGRNLRHLINTVHELRHLIYAFSKPAVDRDYPCTRTTADELR